MNLPRHIAVRLFILPFLILVLAVALSFVLKPLSDALAGGPHDAWARPLLSWGILVMLGGYAVGAVWLMVAMWRFMSWARGDMRGECPRCRGRLKSGAGGARRCPLCGYRERR